MGERGKIVETVSTLDSTSSRPSRHEETAPSALGKAASFLSSPSRSRVVVDAGGGRGEPHGDWRREPAAADARRSMRVDRGRPVGGRVQSSWPLSPAEIARAITDQARAVGSPRGRRGPARAATDLTRVAGRPRGRRWSRGRRRIPASEASQ